MRIRYRLRDVTVDEALREWAQRSLHFALGRTLGEVVEVVVVFDHGATTRVDVEGVRCQLRAQLRGGKSLTVGAKEHDPRAAIERAASRLARSVARGLQLRREGLGPRRRHG